MRRLAADEVEEELVDAGVAGELGVKGGGEEVAFSDEDWGAVAGGEGFDPGAGVGDAGGADEDHFERAAGEGGGGGEDGGVDLAAVGVALYGDVQGGEGALSGMWTSLARRMAPAQVPKVGVVLTKVWRVSKKPLRSRNLSMVVDSPPGMMRPSIVLPSGPESSAGVRMSFGIAPRALGCWRGLRRRPAGRRLRW